MAPAHTEVARCWTLTVLCFSLVVLSGDESAKTFSWRRFCLSPGPPFLPLAFLSLPVITTCSSCPHGTGLCSRKQCRGGGLGGAPATLKQGIGQGLLPTGARSQGEEERGRGPPTCSHSSPSQAAFLPALVAWSPERNVPFGAWLSLAKAWVHHPVSSVLPLYSPSSW